MELHQQKAHPKKPDPGLDLHLEATCWQEQPFPKLIVWDRCSPVSENSFGFSRPEHRSPAQRKGIAAADRTWDLEQLTGIAVCTPALYTFL